jgi:hypothetical protein
MDGRVGQPILTFPFPTGIWKVSSEKLVSAADLLEGQDDPTHCKWESAPSKFRGRGER